MTDPNGPANMIATALFWTVGIVVLARIGKAMNRQADRYLNRHVRRALDTGDAQVRAFVTEVEAWDAEQTALSRRTR